ncbi:hypothetical protein BJ741DRAFT_594115 [Chytriomyces cf. hyalinus JEL632]|nr:hypothetical protein BJ741DRAFT_594115 [Chytriomyces cf. hyalinus JEL632]
MTATKTHDVISRSAPSVYATRLPQSQVQDQQPQRSNATDKRPQFSVFRRFESAIHIPRKSLSVMYVTLHSSFAHMDHDTMDAVVDCGIFAKRPIPDFDKKVSQIQEAISSPGRQGDNIANDVSKQQPGNAACAPYALAETVKTTVPECMESACTLNASLEDGLSL